MSDISDITILVRYLVQDFAHTMIPGDVFTYNTSAVFTISESNVITVTSVLHSDVELGSGDYSYDASTNKVTVSSSLTSGDVIEVQYTYYPNYSASELEGYIRAAVLFLSVNHYYTFEVDVDDNFYPDLFDKEKNMVAFVTSILIKPENKTYRLPDMSISVPKSLPTRDIVSKAIAIFKHNSHGIFDIV